MASIAIDTRACACMCIRYCALRNIEFASERKRERDVSIVSYFNARRVSFNRSAFGSFECGLQIRAAGWQVESEREAELSFIYDFL